MSKKLVSGPTLTSLAQIRGTNFFFFFKKNSSLSVARYHGQLSSGKMSEKNNDPNLRKLKDGWSDRTTT